MIGVKRSAIPSPTVLRPVAVLCDIHGNLPALEACLAELRDDPPDAVVIGGDVAAGPMPNEVLAGGCARCRGPCTSCAGTRTGSWSRATTGEAPAHPRSPALRERTLDRDAAEPADRRLARRAPPLVRLDVEALGEVLFCHGTPRSDEERVTVFTPPARLARSPGGGAGAAGGLRAHPPAVRPCRRAARAWSTPAASAAPTSGSRARTGCGSGPPTSRRPPPCGARSTTSRPRRRRSPPWATRRRGRRSLRSTPTRSRASTRRRREARRARVAHLSAARAARSTEAP